MTNTLAFISSVLLSETTRILIDNALIFLFLCSCFILYWAVGYGMRKLRNIGRKVVEPTEE